MRRGEALGMMWEDIDTDNGLLHISRGVTHPQQNQPNIETLPTTKSGVRDCLQHHQESFLEPF